MIRMLVVVIVAMGLMGCTLRKPASQTVPTTVREIVRVCDFARYGDGRLRVLSPSRGQVYMKLDSMMARLHRLPVMSASVAIDHVYMVLNYDRLTHSGTLMPIGRDSLMCQTFVEDVNVMW